MNKRRASSLIAALVCGAALLQAQGPPAPLNTVRAGEFVVDPPTLINLGFEWFIEGDDNRNASVEVSYRKQGETAWKTALPMLRLHGERISRDDFLDVVSPNMFAGSILDLEPDTTYEAQFVLADPDGARGQTRKVVTVRTRREPMPATDGRTFHVYPPGFKGAKQEPAFEGLMCAYNLTCAGTDWATAGRPRVRPGDVILVHAGVYKYNRYEYTNDASVNRTVPLDGTYYLTADGTEDRPIAIKGAGDGEAIFDGAGNFTLFDVKAADYTYFEGLTFRNTDVAISAGVQFIAGSKGLTVKRSHFEQVSAGIFTNYSGSSNFYVADNVFVGRNDPNHVIGWAAPQIWSKFSGVDGQVHPPPMASYVAVKLYGPGHVVAYNAISHFHDGVNIETYGNPDGSAAAGGPKYPPKEYWSRRPVAIDFYNNLMDNFHDNPFETDGGMHNIRVLRNVMLNSASHAFCNQPSLGGPTYWIGNIAYHLPGGSTRLTNGSAGADVPQHDPVRDDGRRRLECPSAKQPVSRREHGAGDLRRDDVHEVQLVRLQRLQTQSWSGRIVPVGPAGRWGTRRFSSARPSGGHRSEDVQEPGRVQRRDRTGFAQRPRRLRHLRRRAAARRGGCEVDPACRSARRSRLPVEAGSRGSRPRRRAAEHQ